MLMKLIYEQDIANKPRKPRRRIIRVLFPCIALLATMVVQTGCGNTGPTEEAAADALNQLLEQKTQGLVKAKTFRKTDGLEDVRDASRVYTLICKFQLEIFDRFRTDNFHADIPGGSLDFALRLKKFEKGW